MNRRRERPVAGRLPLVLAVLLAAVTVLVPVTAVAAGETPSTTEAPPPPDIIPEPNSGVEPSDPGDRGGALQVLVLALVVAAVAGAGALLVRQSRRAKAARDR